MRGMHGRLSMREFQKRFSTEAACRKHLYKYRWPKGFVCPACGKSAFYRLPKRNLIQCKSCLRQTSVTAGTVMHKTRTPLRVWFWAIYLMANDKRGISALQISKKLAVSYYVAWTMLHKIRRAMRENDPNRILAGIIQASAFSLGNGPGGDKRGRNARNTVVTVRVGFHGQGVTGASMRVADRQGEKGPRANSQEDVARDQSDRRSASRAERFSGRTRRQNPRNLDLDNQSDRFPGWLQIIAANARSFLLGTFHGIGDKHLQRYLDEFCYRFNRRGREPQIFELLLDVCLKSRGITYSELTQ